MLTIARRFHRSGQTLLLCASALACETDFVAVQAPALESVVVTPSDRTLAPGETQQFSAHGIDAAGDTVAVTVMWSASGGRIGAAGLFTASEPGTYSIVATVAWERSLQGSAVLSVAPAAPDTDGSTPPGPARVDPVAGLVAHWTLDEGTGTVGVDATGNGHDVTLESGAGWTTGQLDGALALDGSDDFAELAASAPLATPLTTWAAWVRTPSPTTAYQMLMTLGKDVRELRFDATTGRVQTNWLIGGVKRKATSPTALSPNTWYHVAATFDGSEVVLYVDGVAVDVVGTSGSFAVASESLYLGRRIDAWHLGGALDDVRIYDRALTPSEIAELATLEPDVSTTLSIVTQPPELSVSGSVFTQAPQVLVEDASGDPLPGQDVTVAIASGGGSLGGTTTVATDATGIATFTDLSITGGPGVRTLAFTSGGEPVTSAAVHVSYAPGTYVDVEYCSSQRMDVYIPGTSFARPLPAAAYVHGGGWVGGDKSTGLLLNEVRDELLARGYLVVSLDYRLATSSSNQWPAQIEDVKCAVRHLRARAGDYGLDGERIGAWGASAGGHLVSMLGATDASSGFEGDGGFPGASSRLQAAVPVGGISDLTGGPTHDELDFTGPEVTFDTWPGPSPELTDASPITWASSDDPPFLIVHGELDDVVLFAQADTLRDELAEAGVTVTLRTVAAGGHNLEDVGSGTPTPSVAQVAQEIAGFFDVHVAQTTPPVPDTEAPSVPEGLTAGSGEGNEVVLSWSAATDNVAVTGYRVYRDDVELATVTETTHTDPTVEPETTYTYEVTALDAAGNESAPSPAVSITVQPTGAGIAVTNITDATTGGPSTFGGHGISLADVTGDGLPDFYVTIHLNDVLVGDLFYRNLGGGTFAEEAAARGIDDSDFGSHGAVWADLDNDGDYDLYNGGTGDVSATGSASDVNNLYRSNGDGTFTDMTPADDPGGATRGVLAVDLERDGDLDLLAVNGWQGQGDDQPTEQFNEIYRNDGGLSFTYLSSGAFQSAPAGQGAVASDYDGDGDVDVFAGNQGPLNVLENVGGSFVQRSAASLGISDAHEARDGVTTADVNNDGHVDLLLAGDGYGHLYLNDGDGTFTHRQSFTDTEGYMGGFADLDHDGDLDLVFAGDNRVFVNDGSGSFPTSVSVPIGAVDDPRSIAFADIDDDGDLDFFVAQKRATNRLIRNDYSGGNRWLKVRLTSPQGQAGAFGAKVRVYLAGTATLIAFREARGAYGYVAQDDPVLHVGLGAVDTVDVEVTFLNGSPVVLTDVAANQTILVGP